MGDTQSTSLDRVLLVDDNPTNLQVLFGALEQEGYELLIAQSGEEALEIANSAKPQLILLDINMPGIDGYETCRQLKANNETRGAVVIFLSARGAVEDKVRGLELGAVDYIEKPFQFEEVLARVRQHLSTFHAHRKLRHENKQLKALVEGGFRELGDDDLAVLIGDGESDHVEFKSTLRKNLHTEKPDKKIENACLKTVAAFLNSEGGFLIVGVDDAGVPLGIEADGFDNEDKFLLHWNGILRQSLGVQVTPRIRSTLLSAGGKRVLVVQCLPSNDPVFFRRDNDELFYVRTGNGTNSLTPSEVLRYIRQRSEGPKSDSHSAGSREPKDRVGQYTLGDPIGTGGMGTVYQARHAFLNRPAAIKLLDPKNSTEKMVERFQREVQLSSQLTHPNTITIYDYGRRSDGSFYYVMELVPGMTLTQLVRNHGPQDSGRVNFFMRQVCGSLSEAHELGLVHRDIKPDNVMICFRTAIGEVVKVLDFGLVRSVAPDPETDVTLDGEWCGTPGFISPEMVSGAYSIDARSDIYSLAASAWYLLTGETLFQSDSAMEMCRSHLKESPRRPSSIRADVDPDLEAVIMNCLEKLPANRPPSTRLLLSRLLKCTSARQWNEEEAAQWWHRQSETMVMEPSP